MNKNKVKRYGIGAVAAGLIIGLGIGLCAGFMIGSRLNRDSEERQNTESEQTSEQITEQMSEQVTEQMSEQASQENTSGNGAPQFSFDQEPVLTIDNTTIYQDEINARVYRARDQYVSLYGEEPWNMELESGVTVAEQAKDTMLDEMVRVTILGNHAGDYDDMQLDDDEWAACEQQADDYMAELGVDVAAQFSVTRDAVLMIYEKDALAMKVYNRMLEDISSELRQDEAYSNMEDNAFEKVLKEKFDEQYREWKHDCQIETTETWNQLMIGAVG